MQTLKQTAQQGRFQAMLPPAVAERQALAKAISATMRSAEFGRILTSITEDALDKIAAKPQGIVLTELAGHKKVEFLCRETVICVKRGFDNVTWVQRNHAASDPWLWFGDEKQVDQFGRSWERSLRMVCDDFGDLVEVPQ